MSKVSVIVPVYNVENYIKDMLQSVQNQTFKDFEVILINDGSTDNSQAIIDEFCRADKRFKCFVQKNAGVSAARNKGIGEAAGEFIVFYDPDDFVPKNALDKMYKTASAKKADMVIGIMEEKSLGESMIYMGSQILAKRDLIEPSDPNFIRAWSLCNKMFSLDFIRRNNLKFEKLHNAEDGVFTFCALNCNPKIYGCNVIAYNYVRRPFWHGASATQIVNREFFMGLMSSHDRIIEEAHKLTDKIEDADTRKKYLQALYIRFIDAEMLNAYYRMLWKAEDDIVALLEERTSQYRAQITEEQWSALIKGHRDLQLERGFLNADRLANEPDVSIVIAGDMDGEQVNMILGSIYNQLYQRFEVLLPSDYNNAIETVYTNMPNLHFYEDTDFLAHTKGKYLCFFDEFAIFTKASLKNMVSRLDSTKSLDFVSMLLKHYDGENYSQIPCLSAAFGYTKGSKQKYSTLTGCDVLFANKLFRREVLEDFTFTDDPAADVEILYRALNFEKMRKGVMITDMTQEDILSRVKRKPSALSIRLGYIMNEGIRQNIEKLKRHINKEDIKRLKKKIGK